MIKKITKHDAAFRLKMAKLVQRLYLCFEIDIQADKNTLHRYFVYSPDGENILDNSLSFIFVQSVLQNNFFLKHWWCGDSIFTYNFKTTQLYRLIRMITYKQKP